MHTMSEEKPEWLRVRAPAGEVFERVREEARASGVRTVCDSSHCPNLGECWSNGHATFMLLGRRCTRRCGFCAVEGGPCLPPDPQEPARVAGAVARLGLRHAVLTSVARDDLPDQGAGHFAAAVGELRRRCPGTRIELLIPDLGGDADLLATVVASRPDVLGHNLETVRRLQPAVRDRRAGYERSLEVLRRSKELAPGVLTKSSLMLGLGEEREEISMTLQDLREAGVDLLAVGQYLRPRGGRLPVARYLRPEEFEGIGREARARGFRHAASGPLVRTSYRAGDAFEGGSTC